MGVTTQLYTSWLVVASLFSSLLHSVPITASDNGTYHSKGTTANLSLSRSQSSPKLQFNSSDLRLFFIKNQSIHKISSLDAYRQTMLSLLKIGSKAHLGETEYKRKNHFKRLHVKKRQNMNESFRSRKKLHSRQPFKYWLSQPIKWRLQSPSRFKRAASNSSRNHTKLIKKDRSNHFFKDSMLKKKLGEDNDTVTVPKPRIVPTTTSFGSDVDTEQYSMFDSNGVFFYRVLVPTPITSTPILVATSPTLLSPNSNIAILPLLSRKTGSSPSFSTTEPVSIASQINPSKPIPKISVVLVSNSTHSLPKGELLSSPKSTLSVISPTNLHPEIISVLQPSMQALDNIQPVTLRSDSSILISTQAQLVTTPYFTTSMPTPLLTVHISNTSTYSTDTRGIYSSVVSNKIINSFNLTPTYPSPSSRTKKSVSMLGKQLRSASLSSSNVVLLLNNSMLTSLSSNQRSTGKLIPTSSDHLTLKQKSLNSSTAIFHGVASVTSLAKTTKSKNVIPKFSTALLPDSDNVFSQKNLPNTKLSTSVRPYSRSRLSFTYSIDSAVSSKYKSTPKMTTAFVKTTAEATTTTIETKTESKFESVTTVVMETSDTSHSLTPNIDTNLSTSEPNSSNHKYTPIGPVPDWETAKKEWKAAWEAHIYSFGALFLLLAVYLLISIVRMCYTKHLLSNHYFMVVCLLIFTFCVLRSLFLLIDGYNSNCTFIPVVEYSLYSMGFPCLTSSFGILFYALLTIAKVQYLPAKIQRLPVLISIIFLHFILPMVTAVLIGLLQNATILLFICQIFFVIWGLFLFIGYMFVFRRLHRAAEKRQKLLLQLREAKCHMDNFSVYRERLTLCLGISVTLFISIIGMFCACLQVYVALSHLEIFPKEVPRPWPWWGYQTSIRFLEFLFCLTMIYVATQPFKHRSKYGCDPWFYCSSCLWLCRREIVWNATKETNWTNLDEAMTNMLITKDCGRREIKAAGYDIIPLTITLSQDSETQAIDSAENDSMLIVENGFVRFRTNQELEELRQSPRIPRMHVVESKSVPIKTPKTLQWSNTSNKGHQNGGFQSRDVLLSPSSSPECISSSTSPSSSQWNRVSTAGSDITYRAPSLSLADSIDKELEHFFRNTSHRSLCSVSSAEGLDADEDSSSSLSVFQADGNLDATETGDSSSNQRPSFYINGKNEEDTETTRDKLQKNTNYLSHDNSTRLPANSSQNVTKTYNS